MSDRDDTIRRLRAEGLSLREIARRVGMSPMGVQKVLRRSAVDAFADAETRERERADHEVLQAVVAFPSANDAARFFSASAQRGWPACSNRQYHNIDPGKPDKVWTVGPIANTNGTLSTTDTLKRGNGWVCQRALTVSNNIAIDVASCADNPAGAAINIAHQIAMAAAWQAPQ